MRRRSIALLVVSLALLAAWRWPASPAARRPGAGGGVDRVAASSTGIGPAAAALAGRAPTAATVGAPRASSGEVVVRCGWGSDRGQLGRRREQESNPEAPMAIAVGARGDFALVDQVNRRVERFLDGKWAASIPLGGDTAQDLALGPSGRTAVLDRLGDRALRLYDAGGKLENEIDLAGAGVKDPGAATGVFADEDGFYVERDHGRLWRVAGADGRASEDPTELAGRPTRDGRLLVRAALAGRGASAATVSAFDRASGRPAWSATVALGAPVLHLVMLDSDAHGYVYLAADVGEESPAPPYAIGAERIVVVRLDAVGHERGTIVVPAWRTADETFRPMSVDADGAVYVMAAGEDGLGVVRYTFSYAGTGDERGARAPVP